MNFVRKTKRYQNYGALNTVFNIAAHTVCVSVFTIQSYSTKINKRITRNNISYRENLIKKTILFKIGILKLTYSK